jgi:hypothetical protein
MLRYILFGAVVTLGDMMIIAATIWSAILLMTVAFFQRFSFPTRHHLFTARHKILGNKGTRFVLDPDSSIHSDLSDHSTVPPESVTGKDFVRMLYFCFLPNPPAEQWSLPKFKIPSLYVCTILYN